MKNICWRNGLLAIAAAAFLAVSVDAQAYQVKRIVRGSQALTTNEVFSVDLTAALTASGPSTLNTDNTLIIITSSDNQNAPVEGSVYGILDDDHTLTLVRNTANGTSGNNPTVEYQLVEFVSGVTIYSGLTPFADSGASAASKTIKIPTVDRNKTFAVISWKSYTGTNAARFDAYQFKVDLSDSTHVRIQRQRATSGYRADVFYQVVAFDTTESKVDVQYGTKTLNAGTTTGTVDLSNANACSGNGGAGTGCHSITLAKSFVVASADWGSTSANSAEQGDGPDTELKDANTLSFVRGFSTDPANISFFLVQLTDENKAWQGRIANNATTTPNGTTGSNFVLARTLGLAYSSLTGTDATGYDSLWIRVQPSGNTNVGVTRATTTTNANVSWYANEFPPLQVLQPASNTWVVGSAYNIQWEHASDLEFNGSCNSGTTRSVQIDGFVNGGYQNIYTSYANGAAPAPATCANTDTYSWTIPDVLNGVNVIGTGFKVKVSAEEDVTLNGRNFDETDTTYTIVGAVDTPTLACNGAGGSCASGTAALWPVGATDRVIHWVQHGALGRVKLNVSTNGTTWNDGTISLANSGGKIATVDPASPSGSLSCSGSTNNRTCDYNWTPVPDLASATLQVRVLQADTAGSTLNGGDISTTTNPNGAARVYTTAAAHGLNNGDKVDIRDDTQSACNVTNGTVANKTATTFTITEVGNGNGSGGGTGGTVTKRIGSTSTLSASSAAFEIRPSVTVTYPTGTTKNVSASTNASPIQITATAHGFSTGDTVTITGHTQQTNANGSWVITKVDANNFTLNSSSPNGSCSSSCSGTVFRGDSYNRGVAYTSSTTPKTITWTSTGTISNYDIYLSYDSGTSYLASDQIATNIGLCGSAPCYTTTGSNPATNTFNWTPAAGQKLGANCKIAVVKTGQNPLSPTIGDEGPDAGVFSVIGSLTLVTPAASQANPTWKVGGSGPITWTVLGGSGVTNLVVKYATNCTGVNCATTATWQNLPGGLANPLNSSDTASGAWPWPTLPSGVQGANTGIRIEDSTFPSLIYDQKGPFSVKLGLSSMTSAGSPINTNDVFRVGTAYTIGWTNSGTPPGGGLSLQYSINGGAYTDFSPPLTGLTNSASVTFSSSAFINDNVTLKVFDPADGTDTVNGVVLISPVIRVKGQLSAVTLKKGGSVSANYNYGDTMTIGWTLSPAGYTPNVDIYYSTNNGADGFGLPGTGQKIATVPMSTGGGATTGSYDWVIDRTAVITGSSNVLIRVVKNDDTNVTADSSAVRVKGRVTVTNPTGSPWLIGSNHSLTYTADGITNVEILLATDGATFNTIVPTTTATGSYAWNPLPNNFIGALDSSSNVQFKVRNADDPSETTTTTAATTAITVKKQIINVNPAHNTTPVTTLYVDDNAIGLSNVIWTSQGSTSNNVVLNYDTNSGSNNYNGLINGGSAMSDAGGYIWQVPDIVPPKTTMRVRVKSSADATVYGETADFTIRGKIDTLVPSAATTYNYNAPIAISWANHGSLGAMTIKMASDGTNYTTTLKNLASTTNNSTNSWTWTTGETGFPPAVGSTYKIKVEQDGDASNVFTTSANNFKVGGVLTLTTLTGADSNAKWANVSDVKAITWNKSPATFGDGIMQLYYSTTGATTCSDGSWVNIDPSPGSFPNGTGASWNWTIPGGALSSNLKLKLQTSAGCSDSFVISSATNASVKGGLSNLVIAGTPTLQIRPSPAYSISWSSNPSTQGNVNINLYTNGGVDLLRTLATVDCAASPYSYTPNNNEISNDYNNNMVIKVELASDATGVHVDSPPFTLMKKYANVAVPSGVLRVDDNTALLSGISWNTYGNKAPAANYPVILSYDTSSGSGGFTGQINSGNSMPDNEAYTWQVPDSIGTGRVVRVKSSTFPTQVLGDSSAFEIKGKIDTLTPGGGEVYNYGADIPISWYNHGSLGAVTIKFDNGSTVTTIKNLASSTNNALNSWTWTTGETGFPPAVGTTYKIKVEQNSDASNVSTTSSTNFRVKGVLSLTTANTDGLWGRVGGNQNITWTKTPAAFADGQLQLFYSTTGATTCSDASWVAIPPDPNTTTGSPATWQWSNIPAGAATATLRLKLQTTAGCSDAYNISTASSVAIKGQLTNLTTAGTPWLLGTQNNIAWTSNPSSQGNVLIEYTTDGTNYSPVTGNAGTSTVGSQTSPFPWTIPTNTLSNDLTSTVKVRVKLISDPNDIVVESASPFTIQKRYISVSVPSSTLFVGDNGAPSTITWNTQGNTGSPNQVVLAYDNNSGANGYAGQINGGNPITDNGSFVWQVPDAIGDKVRVRVKSNGFSTQVYGDSAADFSIKGKVTPDSGIGSLTLVVGQPASVNFAKAGTIGNLKIEYIHNGNSTVITPGPTPGPEGTNQATSFNWSSVVDVDSLSNGVIDVGGTKNSTFKFTGLGQTGALQATATSAAFQVRGNLQNLKFDGSGTEGQVLYIGSSHFIQWKPSGNLGNVRIRMDRFGGLGPDLTAATGDEFNEQLSGPDATYPTAESIPYDYQTSGGVSKWEWTLPDSSSNQCLIRVESLDNPWNATNPMATYVSTASGTPFRIRGTYAWVNPNSAVKWKVQSTQNIDWTPSAAGMGHVDLVLFYDGDNNGSLESSTTLATDNSTKPFPWTINASLVTEHAVLRVKQTTDSSNTVFQDSTEFKIKPKLQLTAPNSNADQWVVGSQNDITWLAPVGSASSFKINVSTDGGSTWNDGAITLANKGGEIAPSAPSAALAYSWTVPDIMTNQGIIRIRKENDGDIEATDDSDGFFYVKGSITNVHIKNAVNDADPSVPIDLPISTTKYVTWNYTGSLGTVDLTYTTNANAGSPTYTAIPGGTGVSVGTGGVGSFAWTIPNAPSANVRVKVTSSASANWQTVSGTSFASAGPTYNSIIGSITAMSPDSGVTDMVVGGTKTIRWTPNGAIPLFDVYYKVGAGSFALITPGAGVAGTVSGAERTWDWTNIPDTISSQVRFRVADHDNPTKTFLDSSGDNTIKGSVDLTNPNGSNTLTIGTPYNITWTSTGSIGNLKIEMSTDNFTSDIRTIVSSYSSANSPYAWTPSATVAPVINYADMDSDIVKVRLTSIGGIPVSDASQNAFKIVGTITSVQPSGSANIWLAGSSHNITWSQIGNVGAVDIYYRTSGGATPYDIPIVTNHTGHSNGANSFTWNPVHDVNSETVYIRVLDHNNSGVFADSAQAFSIRPTITVTSPIASDRLVVGDPTQTNIIKWTTGGTVGGAGGTVKVLYDSGSGYLDPANVIADNVPVGNGTAGIAWNPIPDAISSTVKVKVVDKSNATVFGESAIFKIKGSITLSNPKNGVHWLAADTSKNVTWSMTGTLPAVDLEYNLNGGTGGWTSIGQASAGATTLPWNPVPTTATNNAQVRLKADYSDDELDILSTGTDFFIENTFANTPPFLEPRNGQVVKVGDSLPHITWNVGPATGITAVKIEFTNNASAGGAGPTWTQVTNSAPNTGDFTGAWTWPGTLSDLNNDCRLRITQFNPLNTNTTFTATGSAFSIQPTITVTEPTGSGSESWGVNTHHDIKFKKKGAIQSVDIYYAADGTNYDPTPINGATPVDVSSLADDTVYTYDWLVDTNTALTSGFTGKIKVKVNNPSTQGAVQTVQSGTIEIKGTLTLNTPSASGITLYVGDTYNSITWSKFGAITNVDLHYSVDGGAYQPIVDGSGTPATNIPSVPSSYSWLVPDTISGVVKVRVRDHNNPNNVLAESANTFRILGKLTLTVPDLSGITWVVGQNNKTISWTSTGSIQTVDIDLARYGNFGVPGEVTNIGQFSNCTPTPPSVTCNGSAAWTQVQDLITSSAKIRVRDHSFPNDVTDISANAFNIVGSFNSVSSPGSGNVWFVGETTHPITWDSNGTITNVKIEYKTSIGGALTTIVADNGGHTAGTNSYTWSVWDDLLKSGVADEKTTTAYIHVSDKNFPSVFLDSPVFTIRPKLAWVAPAANARIVVGSNNTALIQFSVIGTKMNSAKVLFDTAGGAGGYPEPDNVIAANVTVVDNGTTSVDWNNVPDAVSNNVKIKVVDNDDPTNIFVVSPTVKIVGSLAITDPPATPPATKVQVKKGGNYLIKWDKTGTFLGAPANQVEIWYATDGVNFNNQITAGTAAGGASGQYLWTNIPNTTSPNVVLRISDLADNNTKTFSAPISIQSTLNITQPDNGEVWEVGDNTKDITWTADGTTTNAKLQYATNGGGVGGNWVDVANATNLVNGANNTFNWAPIPDAISSTVKVRVIDLADTDNWNESTNTFKIKGKLTVVSPNGAEPWTVGTTQPIRWTKNGTFSTVKLQYSVDGGAFAQITTPTNATGIDAALGDAGCTSNPPCWNWQIPDSLSSQVKVRVVNEADPTNVLDDSNANFTIQGQLTFNPALPASGDAIWYVGDSKTLTWTKTGTIPTTRLEYSTDGTNYNLVTGQDNLAGLTTNLTVPNTIAPVVTFRLANTDGTKPTVKALTGNIEIKGKLHLDTPVGSDAPVVDDTFPIKWTPTGTMNTVKLEYSTNGFADETQTQPVLGPANESAAALAAGATGVQQTFNWKIPSNISNTVKVRITNNADPAGVKNLSPAFKIVGGFKVLTPNGGGFFEVDGATSITWESHGSMAQAKLEYSTNGFINETQTFPIATVPASDLSYSWTIPDKIGPSVKVRISDLAYNGTSVFTLADVSDAAFEVRGKLEFNAANADLPLGSEAFLINSDRVVKWTKHGTIASTKVEYSINNGPYNYILDASNNQASSVAGSTFTWRVPDQKTLNGVRVRVTNVADGNVVATSNLFTIRGGFSWTNPTVAGTAFNVGTTPILSWTTFGTIPTINLSYSTNNGFSYVPLKDQLGNDATAVSNNGTFNWTIPNNISKNVFVKVEDATDTDATDTTPKIKIAGILFVDNPLGNERWGVGQTKQIQWHTTGAIANVKLEYSINDGASWVVPAIADTVVASDGHYDWVIPTNTSPTVRVRVSDTITDSGTTPVVSNSFKIVGSLNITAPTSASTWAVTDGEIANPTKNITWSTSGNIPSVNLYYSATGAAPWTLINTSGPIVDGGAGGSFAWHVPDAIGTTTRIRMEDSADSPTFSESQLFTIRGDLKLTSPVGTEKWGVSSVQTVSWQRNGSVPQVYLYYSKNGSGGPWIGIVNPQTGLYPFANSGNFAWTVPDDMTTLGRVKIENVSGPSISDASAANFKIMARFDVRDPDGGEIVVAGNDYTIRWDKWGTAANVKIELATDGNVGSPTYNKVISANTPNNGTFNWLANAVVSAVDNITPAAKIRISDVNDIDSANASFSSFIIRASFVLSPSIGSVPLKAGDTYDIVWTKKGNIPQVKLQYSPDNFFSDVRPIEPTADGLVPNVGDGAKGDGPSTGRYVWTVPDIEAANADSLTLRISDPNDASSNAVSNSFRIIPKFTVLTPNGDPNPNNTQKLKVGVPYTITWSTTSGNNAQHTPSVKLLLSTNGGGSYPTVIATTANDGSFDWVTGNGGVPDFISDQVKIRVEDASDNTAFDESDNNLKIIGNFTLSAPNGGAVYEVGDPLAVSWTNLGTVPNVELSYSTIGSDFTGAAVIAPGTVVNGTGTGSTFNWTVPNAIGPNVRMRVRSLTDDGFDISDNNFRIRGKLTVSAPANGTPVPIGQTYRIQWTTNGTVPNVNIVYDTQDGAGGYPGVIATNVPNTGFFDWVNVPDVGTNQARIRVIDARVAESDVIGTSAKFNIVGNFTMLTPTNGDAWIVNTPHDITWHWGGTIQRVKLSYTTNPALPDLDPAWTDITTVDYGAGSGNGNNGTSTRTYTWTVPDDIAPVVRVKVENADDPSVYDIMTGTMKIRGGFTLSAPALNDRWVTNEIRNISWTTNGTVPFVKLEYSYDNFATSTVIAGSLANNASGLATTFAWTVPDPGVANVPKNTKIRVSSVADSTTFGDSNAFNVDYYRITWEIRDLVTNASLSQLTVNEVKSSDPTFIQWSEAGISTNPPRVQPTPYGTWVATWSKAGFGDGVQVVVANQDQSILLFMETSTVHIWLADSQVSYDPVADKLSVVAWLSRDGSITTGAVGAVYKIYDGATSALLYTLTDNAPDAAGFMNFSVNAPTGFVAGKTYTAICEVTVGSGGVFKTPSSFEITTPATLQAVKNTINANIDKPLSQINTELQQTLTAQTAVITTKLQEQKDVITATLTHFEQAIDSSIVSLESAANQSLASAQTLQDTALKFSWKAIVAPNPALSGTTIVLEAQGPQHLFPIVSVYNSKDKQVIINGLMTEDSARPGNYSYSFPASQGDFEAGQAYTYLVSEDVTGGLVAGSGFIESISLTSVAGLAAAAPAAEKAAKEAVAAIKELEASMAKGGDIKDTMKLLKKAVDDLQTSSQNTPERENKLMRERVADITDKLKQLAGDQGLNFDEMFKKAIDESSSIKDIRSRAGSISKAVDLIGAVVEKRLGGVEEPIVDVQLEPAS